MLGTKITSKIVTIRAEGADITPLLAMEWMKTFNFLTKKIQLARSSPSERKRVFGKVPDLFENSSKNRNW